MHYHMGGSGGGSGPSSSSGAGIHMPTYLFGEHYYAGPSRKTVAPANKEEIYLNKSGWVQVNTKRTSNDENRGYRRSNYGHQNGDLRNTIRVIQIDNTRRSDMTRQALLQHQHAIVEPPKFVSSKVEELIQRNEARLGGSSSRESSLRPGYRIVDPQLANILNERPGFLPVKNLNDHDSPPPITPILSPPPAFQDSSVKVKSFDRRRTIASRPTSKPPSQKVPNCNLQASNGPNVKGMVFSRSFEYDNRRPTPTDTYAETFSRSFDGNLTERPAKPVPLARDRSPNFSTLTGNSPNYLSKKDSGGGSSGSLRSRDSSPKYQSPAASVSSSQSPQTQKTTAYLNTSVKEAPPSYSVAGHSTSPVANKYSPRSQHHERSSFERSKSHNIVSRSRKSQFNRTGSGNVVGGSGNVVAAGNNLNVSRFRSFDTPMSQRLNSCDSGARSDLSNDELDNEDDDAGSSEFLNTNSYHPSTSPFKSQRQRSLTPDRNESHSSSSSLRKQRSLTPESRSLTPEDRRKRGSQLSLMGSRQNSSSRSNTLERNREKVNISRSSSSSSYSGGEHDAHGGGGVGSGNALNPNSSQYRRSVSRNAKQAEEHRIRRSRSLQLTERSPNRGHKMIVCVGQTHVNSNQPPIYQQANIRSSSNHMGSMPSTNFPPTIRTTGKSQSILLGASNGGKIVRQSDIDKSRSFDFDYCNYNSQTNAMKSQHSSSSLLGSAGVLNRDGGALRLDFDKSRSFDDDYREVATVVSNNNLNAAAMRYLQAAESSDRGHQRMRRSSPVEGGGGGGGGSRNTRSPQSSGSSCNNLSVPRQTTSPQNYGTRLCDHEMTYDLMRKSLDRSPIMEFRRGDSAGGGAGSGGDYDMPLGMIRNRETINSGGNSELNFMNNEGRVYEHVGSNSLKQQRSLRRNHSPNESHYSLERSHASSSRDEMTPPDTGDYRNDYSEMYRRNRSTNRGRDLHRSQTTTQFDQFRKSPSNLTTNSQKLKLTANQMDDKKVTCSKTDDSCSDWPKCGACRMIPFDQQHDYLKSLPLRRNRLASVTSTTLRVKPTLLSLNQSLDLVAKKSNISMVQINIDSRGLEEHSGETKTNMVPCNNSSSPSLTAIPKNEDSTNSYTLSSLSSRPSITNNNPNSSSNSNISQWTLLCKNAIASHSDQYLPSPAVIDSPLTNSGKNNKVIAGDADAADDEGSLSDANIISSNNTYVNVKSSSSGCPKHSLPLSSSSSSSSGLREPNQTLAPRVIPLAATSLVFLGDSDIAMTKDRNDADEDDVDFSDIYKTKDSNDSKHASGQRRHSEGAITINSNLESFRLSANDEKPPTRTKVVASNGGKTFEAATSAAKSSPPKAKVNFFPMTTVEISDRAAIAIASLENSSAKHFSATTSPSGSQSSHVSVCCTDKNINGGMAVSVGYGACGVSGDGKSKNPSISSTSSSNCNAKFSLTSNLLNGSGNDIKSFPRIPRKPQKMQQRHQNSITQNRLLEHLRLSCTMSLPDIWLDGIIENHHNMRYPRSTATNDGIRNGFLTNLSHQMRAVSSPSLIDMGDHYQRVPSSNSSNATTTTTTSQDNFKNSSAHNLPTSSSSVLVPVPQNVGVLQKFKRTLTNFNKPQQQNGTSNGNQHSLHPSINTVNDNCSATAAAASIATSSCGYLMADTEMSTTDVTDSTAGNSQSQSQNTNKYRFGPLVWRSSKERRKTKYNRRDKCNSGDSGIQIELENDEQFARALAINGGCLLNSSTNGINSRDGGVVNGPVIGGHKQEGLNALRLRSVRRTNSAKVTSITDQSISESLNKAKLLKRMDINDEREAPESLPTRSLSQPNGLESCGMTTNDLDDSDSDSVTSHEEASTCSYYPIYAEVLYNFTAAGPQELGLEKGTLIEILRKEIGPWWFGRIKKEDASLVEEILDPELGWFPKEFVRVIHSPDTDAFFLRHIINEEQRQKDQESQLMGHLQIQNEQTPLPTAVQPPTSSSPTMVNDNQMLNTSSSAPCTPINTSSEDNFNSTIVDKHNVTTIVIESSSPPPPPPPMASSSPSMDHQNLCHEQDTSDDTMENHSQQKNHQDGCCTTATTTTTAATSALTTNGQTILSTSQSLNVLMGSADILRRSAVKELLDTEVNYVKLLQAICEGYLPAMSKRIDIFSPNSIRLIFSNITAIYKFQRKFLDALRKGIEQNQVGKIFLKMHKGFLCYSTYCNSYPRALIELESYERVKDARTILDNCRESENLAELPLSAHLLAPVQRICRYPLHLAEIMKTSNKGSEPTPFHLHEYEQIDVSQLDIPDTTETIDMALEAMKSITEAVNEGKRHSETIARHQASFQNFKGPPLHLHSTRFFVQVDATRQKQNLWNSSCTLFLFDNQLVYCKRDIIKRSHFIYKGRIFLDRCRVVNVRDGKMFGHTIKNSLRIYCEARDKCYDFSFRSANRKQRFLNTLALERQFSGKALYISEIPGLEYAFEERDYSDQSDYEGNEKEQQQQLKEFLYEANLHGGMGNGHQTNTSGESSVPESPAKSFKYSDTLPKKSTQRLDGTSSSSSTGNNNEAQTTGSLGRRRLGNWFRKPKSSASTPNQSPTHKHSHPSSAHSTGDLQLTGTDISETYTVLENAENGGGVSS
ncbi:rho guanine nucleotide exchange factor 3 isoform X1 [Haematobia irritans]|uniref:rho guanine nucleotide exchange factor 3 isoform X1 n=1 Tax=Haematobia irritans TaxID=7368 RepID=UPI003F50149A